MENLHFFSFLSFFLKNNFKREKRQAGAKSACSCYNVSDSRNELVSLMLHIIKCNYKIIKVQRKTAIVGKLLANLPTSSGHYCF